MEEVDKVPKRNVKQTNTLKKEKVKERIIKVINQKKESLTKAKINNKLRSLSLAQIECKVPNLINLMGKKSPKEKRKGQARLEEISHCKNLLIGKK